MARAEPGSWASPVNGDEVQGTWFFGREGLWVTTPRRLMTCSPASRRSWTPLRQQARWSRTRSGGAVTSTASACSWASSFLTLGLGATSATWPSSAGTRPLTSPTAGPVWRAEGADGRHKRGGLVRRRMLERVARLRPPNRHAPVRGAGRMAP
jgi:hypothetical protein